MTTTGNDRYFELVISETGCQYAELDVPGTQHGNKINIWIFSECKRLDFSKPVEIVVDEPGPIPDIYLTTFDVPIVSKRVADIISEHVPPDEIQILDAVIEGNPHEVKVLNVLKAVDCIDRAKSRIEYSQVDDKFSNIRAGDPLTVFDLLVDPSRIGSQKVFRIDRYRQAIVFHQSLVDKLREASLAGVAFVDITGGECV